MFLAVSGLVIAATVPPSLELQQIRTVYILPMRLGFDQYLANQLAQSGLLRVVTDPKKADAVFTDHLGQTFEEKLDELNPPPKPPPPPPEEVAPAPSKSTTDASKPSTDTVTTDAEPPVTKPPAKKKKATTPDTASDQNTPPRGSFSVGRGNVFLVDKNSRDVVWSTFEQLDSAQPSYLTHVATYVIKDLKHALQPAKVKQN